MNPTPLASTLTLAEATHQTWDAIVIGAGPAGALAAREIGRRGISVLLVDKANLPRWKVCGACVNPRAMATLKSVGLGDLLSSSGAIPLRHLHLAARGRHAVLPLPDGVALSRERLDAALVETALSTGVGLLSGTEAHTENCQDERRTVVLRQGNQTVTLATRIVLAADGLGGGSLRHEPGVQRRIQTQSRIGAGVVLEEVQPFYQSGTIFMACGRGGYVGAVRVEDGRLNLAAALDPDLVRHHGGPGRAAAAILREAGFHPIPDRPWRGTPLLTRRLSQPSTERCFVLGDAAGYVEPFTGEGMAWAFASGVAVAPLAATGVREWHPQLGKQWAWLHRHLVRERQVAIRIAAQVLRHPWLTYAMVSLLSLLPELARPVLRWMNHPE
jgi:menaquinone-9 beta-reductase